MSVNFRKVFNTAAIMIENSIKMKRSEFISKLIDALPVSIEIKDLEKEIKIHEDIIRKLKNKIEQRKDIVSYNDRQTLEKVIGVNPYNLSRAGYNILMKNKDKKEFTNINALQDIVGRFDRMLSLAVDSKEERNILLKFYTLDWKSLGIDVPAELDISNIEIKNGVIISDSKLLSAKK